MGVFVWTVGTLEMSALEYHLVEVYSEVFHDFTGFVIEVSKERLKMRRGRFRHHPQPSHQIRFVASRYSAVQYSSPLANILCRGIIAAC